MPRRGGTGMALTSTFQGRGREGGFDRSRRLRKGGRNGGEGRDPKCSLKDVKRRRKLRTRHPEDLGKMIVTIVCAARIDQKGREKACSPRTHQSTKRGKLTADAEEKDDLADKNEKKETMLPGSESEEKLRAEYIGGRRVLAEILKGGN